MAPALSILETLWQIDPQTHIELVLMDESKALRFVGSFTDQWLKLTFELFLSDELPISLLDEAIGQDDPREGWAVCQRLIWAFRQQILEGRRRRDCLRLSLVLSTGILKNELPTILTLIDRPTDEPFSVSDLVLSSESPPTAPPGSLSGS